MQVGTVAEQSFDPSQAAQTRGPRQRGVADSILRVDVAATVQRLANKLQFSMSRRPHQLVASKRFCVGGQIGNGIE